MVTAATSPLRVGDNLVLCTPTLRSKGEVQADEIALIDLEGNQKAGLAQTHLGSQHTPGHHEGSAQV